ncbi:MAG: DUF305 domain-containing protein [Flavobacterium sp.]
MKTEEHKHAMQHPPEDDAGRSGHSSAMYKRFGLMAALMFVAMYALMYAMIDSWQNLIPNTNNLYMTLLMMSAMLVIELLVMKGMYANKKMNWSIGFVSVAIGVFSWFGIREQINIGDREFAKGMIPHHAAAILMSEKAHLSDPELIQLQRDILTTQAQEIALMKRKLKELDKDN